MDSVPLLRAPESWPVPVVAVVTMTLLAALDLAGAVCAKEWVETRRPLVGLAGVVAFVVLFWVYASGLQYAELAVVTFGWIVVLQVGLVVLDRVRYGVELPPGKWVAVALLLCAQAYLLLGPSGERALASAQ